jgi:hypothetical protein
MILSNVKKFREGECIILLYEKINMKKIILLICILLGISSCEVIDEAVQDARAYGDATRYEKKQERIGNELFDEDTQKIMWNGMELIVPQNTKINERGKLVYGDYELNIYFYRVTRENICTAKKSFKKEWYKKYNNNYYVLEGSTYNNLIVHWNSNINLARKIARENNFTEC